MKWFQRLFSIIALINMVIAPGAIAANQKNAVTPEAVRETLETMGYEMKMDPSGKKALVYQKGTEQVVMEIPFAPESHLRKFSPKSLNAMMLEEMARVKSASKASWSHSVRSLPAESALFFMAMGAVVAGQLITNYSQNPVGLKQHIDHSLSPLGVFGFFTFMYSQGVTSNVLAMYLKNPKFHHMIPYLGMTVGAFLQTYLSTIASDPNVKACVKTWMGSSVSQKDLESGADQDPCGKAYEYLVIKKQIWNFAPGIASMLISSALAGVAQSTITKAVLRFTGVDIALWLVPGSMQVKGIRLLLVKGMQITFFVAIDAWLNRKVNYVWKNMYDGAEFYDQNDLMNELVNKTKESKWSGDGSELQAEVKSLREKMTNWRMMNLSEVYEAHQNWSEALHQMTSMFNSSYAFYDSVVNEIRKARFDGGNNNPLNSLMPLSGVRAKDLSQGKEDLYILNPQFVLGMQLETLSDAAKVIDNALTKEDEFYFLPAEQKSLKQVSALFKAGTQEQAYEGLRLLRQIRDNGYMNMSASTETIRFISELWSSLGDPTVPSGMGQGYAALYEKAPSTAEALRGTNYYRVAGAFQTPKITDYLTVQMLCGPDVEKGEKAIRNSLGYPSVFLPPQIATGRDEIIGCNALGQNMTSDNIYSFQFSAQGKQYKGSIPYLIEKARPSIVGTAESSNFDQWWTKNTQSQVVEAFGKFAQEYDKIVVKLVKGVFYEGRSVFNGRPLLSSPWKSIKLIFNSQAQKRFYEGGPMFNGGMKSALQEERIYLSLLEELMRPSKEFNVEYATILDKSLSQPELKAVDEEFSKLNRMIQRIKISTVENREVITSDLENYELEEQLQNIQTVLTSVSSVLGVGDDNTGAEYQLNEAQRNLAVLLLENLQGLASEVMMYGSMANAVSWEKIRNLKRVNMEQQKFNNDIQAKLNALRGLSLSPRH